MQGIELAREFYKQFGEPMLRENFSDIMPYIAVGLVGSGSECYGYDDDVSRDHDFEAGFCIFLPDEETVDRRRAFELERAYSRLPGEFMNIKRAAVSPVGGNRHGVMRVDEFYRSKIGVGDGDLTISDRMRIPDYALAESTNGEVFFDNYGLFTKIRNRILEMPPDVHRKKLAGQLIVMAQSGQYNYKRCLEHGETGAAQLAAIEFAKAAAHTAFLLNHTYMPYDKWMFRALRALKCLSGTAESIEYLISSPNTEEAAEKKFALIEQISAAIADELRAMSLTEKEGSELEPIAYSVNDKVSDVSLRNMSIFAGA